MPRPRPWWPEPIEQWARELREHGGGGGLLKWLRDHPDKVAVFMSGFIRSDAPTAQRWVEPVYRLKPHERLTESARRRRRIIDDLSVEQQRLICAAGRLLWIGYTASRRMRAVGPAKRKARIKDAASMIIIEMRDLFGTSRVKSVLTLVEMFTEEEVSRITLRRLAAEISSRRPPQVPV
jgi:hypothetical protein